MYNSFCTQQRLPRGGNYRTNQYYVFKSCQTSRNGIILFPSHGKNWIKFNFCRVIEIIYLLLPSKRDVD